MLTFGVRETSINEARADFIDFLMKFVAKKGDLPI